jgi:hypothetical protein
LASRQTSRQNRIQDNISPWNVDSTTFTFWHSSSAAIACYGKSRNGDELRIRSITKYGCKLYAAVTNAVAIDDATADGSITDDAVAVDGTIVANDVVTTNGTTVADVAVANDVAATNDAATTNDATKCDNWLEQGTYENPRCWMPSY